jgi:hypothetical protein
MHDAAAMGSYPRDLFPALDIITWPPVAALFFGHVGLPAQSP